MKISVDKISSSTKNVKLSQTVEVSKKVQAQEGSVIVVKALEENPAYGSIELLSGRVSKVIEGDIIAGTLGERKALKGYSGTIPKEVKPNDTLHLLNMGGVIGKASSGNPELGSPIKVKVLGQAMVFPVFNERIGKPANIKQNSLPWKKDLKKSVPLIFFSASCMDAGKTTAACELIKGLTTKGHKVAATKLTGVSLMRDTLNMQDYGAVKALNFNDGGMVSTTTQKVNGLAKGIIEELNKEDIDCIVIELGDGILGGYGVQSILKDKQLMHFAKAHVVCANDQVAAWGAKQVFKKLGLQITLISGRVTDNDAGTSFIEKELKLPAANAIQNAKKMVEIIDKKVFG